MQKLLMLLVATGCFAVSLRKPHDELLPRLNSRGNLRFSFADSEYEISAFPENWGTAKYYCKLLGMELISIETEEEQDAITEATKNVDSSLWISLNDFFSLGSFMWEATGEYAESYNNWQEGQPKPFPDGYNCGTMGFPVTNRTWFNNLCDLRSRYICEKPLTSCSNQ